MGHWTYFNSTVFTIFKRHHNRYKKKLLIQNINKNYFQFLML